MTESSASKRSPVLDCIIEMMQYGRPLKEREAIKRARPVLETIESAFEFYLGDVSQQHSPIFYLPKVVPEFEKILTNYIIIRFGVFNEDYKRTISYQHTHPHEIPGNTTEEFKEFKKKLVIYDKNGKEKNTDLGSVRKKFNAIAYSLLETDEGSKCFPSAYSNILVCDKRNLPAKRDSVLTRHIYEGFQIHKSFNVITDKDIDLVKQRAKSALKDGYISKSEPKCGNVFILYVNSPRYRSFNSSEVLSKLTQLGYNVRNLFVFKITDRTYSLRTLVEEKNHFNNIYNGMTRSGEDFICYPVSHAVRYTDGLCYSDSRITLECGDNYDNYFPEVASLLEGFDRRQRVLCNILAACATSNCEKLFYEHLQTIDPEFEPEGPISIFEYIRNLWSRDIIPLIEEFTLGFDSFAFMLESSTPEGIKT